MKIRYNRETILEYIDKVVNKAINMDLTWDWPCGVAFYGVCEAYNATQRDEYLQLLKKWVDEYVDLGLPVWTVNTCAMGHTMLTLYEATGEEKYLDIAKSKLDYLTNQALRFGENVLQHTVSAKNDFPEQAWADTLFMAAFFLLRAGVLLKNNKMVDDALNQYFWHIQYLQNPSAGLFYHGYNNLTKDHMSGFYWGRANAWASYTMSQVSRYLPEPYLYPIYIDIESSLRDQLAALKNLQTENGLWRTILDDEESYEEVSASVGIAAAMLAKGNPLHTTYVQNTIDHLSDMISDDGRVLNVSGGTAVMKDHDGYRNIPKRWAQGWGQGLCLAFLSAVLQQPNAGEESECKQ